MCQQLIDVSQKRRDDSQYITALRFVFTPPSFISYLERMGWLSDADDVTLAPTRSATIVSEKRGVQRYPGYVYAILSSLSYGDTFPPRFRRFVTPSSV